MISITLCGGGYIFFIIFSGVLLFYLENISVSLTLKKLQDYSEESIYSTKNNNMKHSKNHISGSHRDLYSF